MKGKARDRLSHDKGTPKEPPRLLQGRTEDEVLVARKVDHGMYEVGVLEDGPQRRVRPATLKKRRKAAKAARKSRRQNR